jgi:mannosyltransferase OCH1-like enzyme
MIPNILHQTSGNVSLPKEVCENIEMLQSQNRDWKYRFYDDNDCLKFIENNYPKRVANAYRAINPTYGAARADFFRYLLIYKTGGLYLDIKSSADRSLTSIFQSEPYILSHWNNRVGERYEGYGLFFSNYPRGELQQWYIASVPGHVFLNRVIHRVLSNIESYSVESFGVGLMGVLKTTGPIAYTQAIVPNLSRGRYKMADTHLDLGLVYSIYNFTDRRFHASRIMPHRLHYSKNDEPVILN